MNSQGLSQSQRVVSDGFRCFVYTERVGWSETTLLLLSALLWKEELEAIRAVDIVTCVTLLRVSPRWPHFFGDVLGIDTYAVIDGDYAKPSFVIKRHSVSIAF
jgi:hypothetical protein